MYRTLLCLNFYYLWCVDGVVFCLWLFVAVKGIKKQHLAEVRSMANPPGAVKMALESICLLLGESAVSWKEIRAVTVKDTFILTIVNFTTDDIS